MNAKSVMKANIHRACLPKDIPHVFTTSTHHLIEYKMGVALLGQHFDMVVKAYFGPPPKYYFAIK